MKHTIFFAIALIFTSQAALADTGFVPRQKISRAFIERVELGENHDHFRYVLGGDVTVNHTFRRIDLNLEQGCRPDEACPKMVLRPIVIQASLVQQYEDGCGSIHYLARLGSRMVGSESQEIHVIDNSRRTCDDVQLGATVIEYTTQTAATEAQDPVKGHSLFIAAPLQSNFPTL